MFRVPCFGVRGSCYVFRVSCFGVRGSCYVFREAFAPQALRNTQHASRNTQHATSAKVVAVEEGGQLFQAVQIVDGQEVIDKGEGGLHPPGQGLVAG